MDSKITYYSLQLLLPNGAPSPLFVQEAKDELFFSANMRLCGLRKMAYLESADLAEKFKEACLPKILKRYGPDTTASIIKGTTYGLQKRTMDKIKKDSELVKARIGKYL